MTFIVILISLIIERFFHWANVRSWNWFNRFQKGLNDRVGLSPYLLLAISILPLLAIVGGIESILDDALYGLLRLIFGVIVLVYCMGPQNLWMQAYTSVGELQSDPKDAAEPVGGTFKFVTPNNSQAFHKVFTNAIFIEANERIFAVVFWFILLGPVGAVLYRTIAISAGKPELGQTQTLAVTLQRILDWLPIRVLTFIFALGGHFVKALALWRKYLFKGLDANDTFLTECGVAALNHAEEDQIPIAGSSEKAALQLLDRSLIMGLVLLAMLVIMAR